MNNNQFKSILTENANHPKTKKSNKSSLMRGYSFVPD